MPTFRMPAIKYPVMPPENPVRSAFVDNVIGIMPRLECRRIKRSEDFDEVFRLRYRAYATNGLIEETESGVSVDSYDLLENCQVFGLYLDGRLASSIRIHRVTPETPWCPAMKSFGELLRPELEQGHSLIDGSRFCVDPAVTPEVPFLPFLTVRIAYMASVYFSSTYNISVVRREHAAFYRRYYGFEKWAGDVDLGWYKLPVDLYVGDMRTNRERIDDRLPFMQSNIEERLMLFADELPYQGLRSVRGMYGILATNSVRDETVPRKLHEWLGGATAG